MSLLSNKDLLYGLRNSNQRVFEDLYDHYSIPLFKNIYKLLPHQEDAEDILQSVFLQLWEDRFKLTDNQSVAGWLFTTSFYKTMNFIRAAAKKKLKELEENTLNMPDKEMPDADNELYMQKVQLFNQAVNLLPLRKKEAFELCKIEGRSYKEAAAILGISEETVKEYVKSAMSILRRYVLHTDISAYLFFMVFIA